MKVSGAIKSKFSVDAFMAKVKHYGDILDRV